MSWSRVRWRPGRQVSFSGFLIRSLGPYHKGTGVLTQRSGDTVWVLDDETGETHKMHVREVTVEGNAINLGDYVLAMGMVWQVWGPDGRGPGLVMHIMIDGRRYNEPLCFERPVNPMEVLALAADGKISA